jgi:hypothetical protein
VGEVSALYARTYGRGGCGHPGCGGRGLPGVRARLECVIDRLDPKREYGAALLDLFVEDQDRLIEASRPAAAGQADPTAPTQPPWAPRP